MSVRLRTMPDQLLALPIDGESFLLHRQGRSVLVDGGWKKDNVVGVLAKHWPALNTLDIVVCTHGDGDHAGGLPDLLKRWPGHIGQVWLPGRWVEVLPGLMRDPKGFVDSLIQELDRITEENVPDPLVRSGIESPDDNLDAGSQGDRAFGKFEATEPDFVEPGTSSDERTLDDSGDDTVDLGSTEPTDDPPWFADLRNAGDRVGERAALGAFRSGRRRVKYRQRNRRIRSDSSSAWLGLIETAKAIRAIAAAAIGRGLRIRWFDFEAFSQTRLASGGVPGFLVPINAREQAPAPTRIFLYATLSKINKEGLVFFAPPKWTRLGVLFCGDSPLGDGRKYGKSFLQHSARPRLPIVATAPHHGAETNKAAYDHISKWGCVVVLLRTGGDTRHPGDTFKKQGCFKLCATCPQSGRSPQLAGVVSAGPFPWYPWPFTGVPCGCR